MGEYTKYKLEVEYDGTSFYGWQRQSNIRTVQEELEQAAGQLFSEPPSVYGASRTDSGVHALGQVAHFRTRTERPAGRVTSALNDYLPDDVTVRNTQIADPDFQAHIDATGKTYVYLLMNRREPPAILRRHLCWHPGHLETASMRDAISRYDGTHNFRGFATNADEEENPMCRIANTEMLSMQSCYLFVITGERFLYNMVRCMVGTLVEIGKGNFEPSRIETLIETQERGDAGAVLPAKGLYLNQVYYEPLDTINSSISNRLQELVKTV